MIWRAYKFYFALMFDVYNYINIIRLISAKPLSETNDVSLLIGPMGTNIVNIVKLFS